MFISSGMESKTSYCLIVEVCPLFIPLISCIILSAFMNENPEFNAGGNEGCMRELFKRGTLKMTVLLNIIPSVDVNTTMNCFCLIIIILTMCSTKL